MRNIIEDQLTKDEKEKAKMLVTQLEAIFMDKLSALTEREHQDYKAINEKKQIVC